MFNSQMVERFCQRRPSGYTMADAPGADLADSPDPRLLRAARAHATSTLSKVEWQYG